MRVEALEGRTDGGAQDAIFIRLGDGVEARMELGGRLIDGQDADVAG